jgi:hypothetical protein
MVRRFIRDESGMTLALSVMMVLLIGVMGAGLLTFVRSDLNSVVEVNRGQKALDIADAGVQVAKAQIRVDSFRGHYDTNRTNDCSEGIRVGGDNWSKATDIYTNPYGYCVGPTTRTDNASTPWQEDRGVTKLFAGGRFHVTIECYQQTDTVCDGGVAGSPENVAAGEKKFFKITSTGYDNAAGNGAIRKVEAIYATAKKTYAPIAYWTPKNINFDGTKCVSRMSFFAGENISGVVTGASACGPSGFIANRTTPAIYGHWQNAYNPTMRVSASSTPLIGAGFGARGLVCGGSTCASDSDSVANGYDDYDRTTAAKGQHKRFVAPVTDPANQITFPFDPGNAIADPSALVDAGLVEEMASAAADQNNFKTPAAFGTCPSQKCTLNTWPAQGAIYFFDAGGNTLDFKVNTSPKAKGVIVVRNGNFQFNNSSNGFEGVIIVIGNGTTTGTYFQGGSVQLDGYVAASGNMDIRGNVSPSTTIDYTNLNSFYDVKLWSWRELYQ